MKSAPIITVVATGTGDGVDPDIENLLGFAQKLQALHAGSMAVWVIGGDAEPTAEAITRCGNWPVEAISCPGLSGYVCEAYARLLTEKIEAATPAFVCTSHTSRGWEWAPLAAACAGAACITGVDDVERINGRICFQKDRYGGKVKGRYTTAAATTFVTVQPGRFNLNKPRSVSIGHYTSTTAACRLKHTVFKGLKPAEADLSGLTEADVIIAAGNGIAEEKNLVWIQRLAELFSRSAVAGTRTICDRGWLNYDQQVGVTGATVAPRLYVACGISGAPQHVMGMRGSAMVIAINTDAQAPMFSEADVNIVADVNRFIPLLLEMVEGNTGKTG
jgi:electron transfer flavoprotein alpha subunit